MAGEVLLYAVVAERHAISAAAKRRVASLRKMVGELATMGLALTPLLVSSGYQPRTLITATATTSRTVNTLGVHILMDQLCSSLR